MSTENTSSPVSPSPVSPNVGRYEIAPNMVLTRDESGTVTLTIKGKDPVIVFPTFQIPGKGKITPPSDLGETRGWEIVRHLGSGDPKTSRVYTWKEGGRNRPVFVTNGDPKRNLRTWIGMVEDLSSKGYLVPSSTDGEIVTWVLSEKGRKSLLPK